MNFAPYERNDSARDSLLFGLNDKTTELITLNIKISETLETQKIKIDEIKNLNSQIEELSLKTYYIGTKANEALNNLDKLTDTINTKLIVLKKIDEFLNENSKPPEDIKPSKNNKIIERMTLFIGLSIIMVGLYRNK
jgi:hypothetical protein